MDMTAEWKLYTIDFCTTHSVDLSDTAKSDVLFPTYSEIKAYSESVPFSNIHSILEPQPINGFNFKLSCSKHVTFYKTLLLHTTHYNTYEIKSLDRNVQSLQETLSALSTF